MKERRSRGRVRAKLIQKWRQSLGWTKVTNENGEG
jgi:hypothetical protein